MIAIDTLSYQSKLRHVHPGVKCAYGVVTLLLCVCTRWLPMALVVLGVNSYLLVVRSGVKGKCYVRYLAVPVGFLLLGTLPIALNIATAPLDGFALSFGQRYVTASVAGLQLALQLFCTALASVTCLYVLSFTTLMPDILWVLGKLHCPQLVMELMLLIYRYIFVLLDVAHQIGVAQASRLGQRDYKTALKSFGALVSMLFIRAMKQSATLYDAMEARCYDGTIRVLYDTVSLQMWQVLLVIGFDGALLLWYWGMMG